MTTPDPGRRDDPFANKDLLAWLSKAEPAHADRVLSALETEMANRHQVDMAALAADSADTRRGQYCGLAVGLTSIIGATVASILGAGIAGATIAGVGMAALAAVSIFGRSDRRLRRPPQRDQAKPSTPG